VGRLFRSTEDRSGQTAPRRNCRVGQPMKYRCAILDDYQNVALSYADWSKVASDVEVKVFNQPFKNKEEVNRALQGFQIIAMMRERTAFLRDTIEALPDLKLLITTGAGNKSIDLAAAAERGVTVAGTGTFGNPDHRHRVRADPGIDSPDRLRERPDEGRRAVAGDGRARHRRHDARHHRAGQARPPDGQCRQGVRHESDRLEPESHAGKMQGGGCRLCVQGGLAAQGRHRDHPCPARRPLARPARRERPSP